MFCDIAYYSIRAHPMLAKRDFVIQRCWKDYGEGKDKVVYNHSVNHSVINLYSFCTIDKYSIDDYKFVKKEISSKKRLCSWYSVFKFYINKANRSEILYFI